MLGDRVEEEVDRARAAGARDRIVREVGAPIEAGQHLRHLVRGHAVVALGEVAGRRRDVHGLDRPVDPAHEAEAGGVDAEAREVPVRVRDPRAPISAAERGERRVRRAVVAVLERAEEAVVDVVEGVQRTVASRDLRDRARQGEELDAARALLRAIAVALPVRVVLQVVHGVRDVEPERARLAIERILEALRRHGFGRGRLGRADVFRLLGASHRQRREQRRADHRKEGKLHDARPHCSGDATRDRA